ncbi:MAG: peptidoglycan DD-metalloendopeptidase family protein, partial [Stackebrandtia sp.]
AEQLGLSGEQLDHAATIHSVAVERGFPERASVVAVATALQESGLRNLGDLGDDNDHDSLGLFQQRPSQGWGTPEQIMDPAYAAGKFYDKLVAVDGWETLPLTVAAQAVQNSAYPGAYAKHEPLAVDIVAALAGAVCAFGDWTHPLPGVPPGSGYRTAERPDHDGVDFSTAKGTPVLAAGAGTVVTVACNAHTSNGGAYSCDVDGSPSIMGCGWYLEIQHPDNTVTRYCHLQTRPLVDVEDQIQTGQPIGQVGSSGNSSGPHLHFETHTAHPATSANAVDPLAYLHDRGVDIGLGTRRGIADARRDVNGKRVFPAFCTRSVAHKQFPRHRVA